MTSQMKWYDKAGAESDVVCSTRVRLARNLRDHPFPDTASAAQKENVRERVKEALLTASSLMAAQFDFVPLQSISEEEAVSLVERHIVSPGFISDTQGKAVLLSKDDSISIMVNEEDHVRIQVIREGFALGEAFETAERMDALLSERLDFAFEEGLGYLTQCPTNLGTGLRVSVMLHLPALTELGMMPRMTANLSKLGMIIRGTYGEGSQVVGAMYQLSNQITLGLCEAEAIENLTAIANQLISEERSRRGVLVQNIGIQDKIDRSAGILKTAKVLPNNEFMQLISYVRLGVSTKQIQGITQEEMNRIMIRVQPATLMAQEKRMMKEEDRDVLRASMVREACKAIKE